MRNGCWSAANLTPCVAIENPVAPAPRLRRMRQPHAAGQGQDGAGEHDCVTLRTLQHENTQSSTRTLACSHALRTRCVQMARLLHLCAHHGLTSSCRKPVQVVVLAPGGRPPFFASSIWQDKYRVDTGQNSCHVHKQERSCRDRRPGRRV